MKSAKSKVHSTGFLNEHRHKILILSVIGFAILGIFFFNGGDAVAVKNGDAIAVDYVGTLEDGTLFDTSVKARAEKAGLAQPGRTYEPLEFTVGEGQMIEGFDKAVVGMKVGETKKITLPPEQAYGPRNENLVRDIPISTLTQAGIENPKVGMTLAVNGFPAKVTKVANGNATIDMNHDLAGKNLVFEITIRKIGK